MIALGITAFGSGKDMLSCVDVGNINKISVGHGYFDDLFVTKDTTQTLDNIVKIWNTNTVLYCRFENCLLAGNIANQLSSISKLRIKAREYGTVLWKTLYEWDVSVASDLVISKNYPFFKGNKTKYEIAIVPVLTGGTEGSYMTNTVISDFDGAYLCTKDKKYHIYLNLEYNMRNNTNKNFITTLGNKKPFVFSNSSLNYKTISVNATFIPIDTETKKFDLDSIIKYRKEIDDFLTSNKTMVFKTFQGEAFIVDVGNEIPQAQNGHYQNVVYSFELTETGDIDSTTDLYNANLSDVDVEGV